MGLPRLTLLQTLDLPGLRCEAEMPYECPRLAGIVTTQKEGQSHTCPVMWRLHSAFLGSDGIFFLFLNNFLGVEAKFL